MALDRLVDNTKLNTALTATADAIRAKTGDNSQINFDYTTDTGFASAISDISSGPSSSDAILIVTMPTGSTVTMTKGGVTLTPTMWVQGEDSTLDCALFMISPSLFDSQNAWTVTATLNENTKSATVTVDSNEQYNLFLTFDLYIYKTGTGLVNGFTAEKQSSDVRINEITIYHASNKWIYFQPAVDLTNFNKVNFELVTSGHGGNSYCAVGIASSDPYYSYSYFLASINIAGPITERTVISLDVSDLTVTKKVQMSTGYADATYYNIWLSV